MSTRIALIIGAAGSFGSHAACALLRHGWQVRGLARDPEAAARRSGLGEAVEWVAGDAMNADDVIAAAAGVSVIVHAANPPRYRNWKGLVLPMMRNTLAAARAGGARVVLPATVYNFAPDAGSAIDEAAPQQPVTRKGRIRVEMEAMLRAAADEGVHSLVLRSGDYFGPDAPNSFLNWLVGRKAGRPNLIYRPGPENVPHTYAYLPDLAETLAQLLDREAELADFEVFHFAGQFVDHAPMAEAVRAAADRADLPVKPFPWLAIAAMSPFNETFRELLEMTYLWRRPIGLDNAKLVRFLGFEPRTPLNEAIAEALP